MTQPTSVPPAGPADSLYATDPVSGELRSQGHLPSLGDLAQSAAAAWVQRKLAEQPWYKRKANTVTAVAGAVVTILGSSAAYLAGAPQWLQAVVAAVGATAAVLAVNVTPNGTTASTGRDLQDAIKDPAVLNAVVAQILQTTGTGTALNDLRGQAEAAANSVAAQVQEVVAEYGRHSRGD